MKARATLFVLLLLAYPVTQALAEGKTDLFAATGSQLPPLQSWSGPGESLMIADHDPWITPAERKQLVLYPVARIPRQD